MALEWREVEMSEEVKAVVRFIGKFILVGLLIIGLFTLIVHTTSIEWNENCTKPGSYVLKSDDTTITTCNDGDLQVWQRELTVHIGGESNE